MIDDFLIGVLSGLTATGVATVLIKYAWPAFKDKCLYNGIRVNGSWDITELRNGKQTKVGRLELYQTGRVITGSSVRTKTRDGKKSERKFSYNGTIHGHQVTLLFDDLKGVGFDTGTYVFTVQNDCKIMIGMATFHGNTENKSVSESRTLKMAVS
jgi:hypothetical protein